jgi:low temperature requirement protein LtrA
MASPHVKKFSNQENAFIPIELLFDLVFAFAISQFSDYLSEHLSWRGAGETLVMLVAVLAAWSYTSWVAVIIGFDLPKTRWMFLGVMLLGLFLNASITRAFTASGWAFILPLLSIQLARILWTIFNSKHEVHRDHYNRVLIWHGFTAPLWIAGAAVNPESRLIWWASAAVVELIGSLTAHPVPGRRLRSKNVAFDGDHMLERCRQFLMIALGQTVVTTGTAVSGAPMTVLTLVTGASALVGTVALWALCFGGAHRSIVGYLAKTKDPIRATRFAVNANTVIIAGLIAVAVANKEVIVRPTETTSFTLSLLLAGGPILFMAAQGWYLWLVPKVQPRRQWIGGVGLLLAGLATLALPSYAALMLVSASLGILVIFDKG